MVFSDNNNSNAGGDSSSAGPTHHEPDDISLILRQLINRSSSSSSSLLGSTAMMAPASNFPPMGSHAGDNQHLPCFSSVPTCRPAVFSGSDRLVVDRISDETLNGVVLSSPSRFFPGSGGGGGSNLSGESLSGSVQLTGFDHEFPEDYDCESEEGAEPAVEEGEAKNHSSRSQSKRSRAAEVHNMSEKRRRSRINEKMKALQNLIPNSNKTDKASMLDEAIEYLKQLQLQVQMLSMRNGMSLHPMCLPGAPGILHPSQLSQMGLDLGHQGGSLDVNTTNALNMTMNTTMSDTLFNLPKQSPSSARPSIPSVSTMMNSEAASFGLESCIQATFAPYEFRDSPQVVCRERSVLQDRFTVSNNETKSLGTAAPLLFNTRESNVKGHNPLDQGRTKQSYGPQELFQDNVSVKNQPACSNFISCMPQRLMPKRPN